MSGGGLLKGLSVCFPPIMPVSHQPRDPVNVVLSLRDTAPSLKVPMAGFFFLPWMYTKVTCGCLMCFPPGSLSVRKELCCTSSLHGGMGPVSFLGREAAEKPGR